MQVFYPGHTLDLLPHLPFSLPQGGAGTCFGESEGKVLSVLGSSPSRAFPHLSACRKGHTGLSSISWKLPEQAVPWEEAFGDQYSPWQSQQAHLMGDEVEEMHRDCTWNPHLLHANSHPNDFMTRGKNIMLPLKITCSRTI